MKSILIKDGLIVTMDKTDSIVPGNLFISEGRIQNLGAAAPKADIEISAAGCAVLPGFVQTHIHLCQTIFRGAADDLALIDWLKQRVWPMEAAHSAASIRASALLGVAELIKGGTTCALTMETVNHTDEVFKVIRETGFRATVGKCMMDKGTELPVGLLEKTSESLEESLALLKEWHGKENGRIRYCFAPRFAVSCTAELLSAVGRLAAEHRVLVHTHASENLTECGIVEQETGLRNIEYLRSLGLTGRNVVLAHCVHVDESEIRTLSQTQTNVAHCPSSNLKLGSGIAPIASMLQENVSVSIGADGAACNNRLDMFTEMRTAALLQKGVNGPEVIPAIQALRMATIEGARAMGLEAEIGSIEIGKQADLAILDLGALHLTPRTSDVVSSIVYSGTPADIQSVIIDGRVVMQDRRLTTLDEFLVREEANREARLLLDRARVAV